MWQRLLGRQDEQKIEDGLAKTRRSWTTRLAAILGPIDITDETWDELEAQLILADVGAAAAADVIAELRREARGRGIRRADELPELLREVLVRSLSGAVPRADAEARPGARDGSPEVTLVVGVNGSGKTTTIAKLARLCQREGRSVLIVAADTYRAAATEQLQVWAERLGVPVAVGQPGGDPGAVVFDALSSRVGSTVDEVIVDTAGRLHTQKNLMAELAKVRRVIEKSVAGAPHETLLVLDATTGQNGLAQARAFTESVQLTGLVLAKLDSSAKGGIAFSVVRELGVPIRFVGTGEQADDLAPFDAEAYAAGLLGAESGAGSTGSA